MATTAASLPTAVLADGLSLVGEALRRLLETRLRVLSVVDASNAFDEAVRASHPDVAVVDWTLAAGVQAGLRQLRNDGYATRFVVTCDSDSLAAADWAMAWGADAFVPKQRSSGELIRAVDTVMGGGRYIAPLAPQRDRDSDLGCLLRLTMRQRQITRFVLLGYSARRIATELNLSPRTVEAHRFAVNSIFNTKSASELRARIGPLAGMFF
jgi:DNA-binding NarL/FixJ family response regulator